MNSPDQKNEWKTLLTQPSVLSGFLAIAYKFIHNKTDAEDIVQDAILDVLQQKNDDVRKPMQFVKQVVATKAKSRYTKQKNSKKIITNDYPETSEPEETLFHDIHFAEILKLVGQNRDETDGKLLKMSYEGYNYEEIAKETGETANNLRQRMFVLRKWLKKKYSNKE